MWAPGGRDCWELCCRLSATPPTPHREIRKKFQKCQSRNSEVEHGAMTSHGCLTRPKLLLMALGCFATGLLLTSSSYSLLSILSPLIFLLLRHSKLLHGSGDLPSLPLLLGEISPQVFPKVSSLLLVRPSSPSWELSSPGPRGGCLRSPPPKHFMSHSLIFFSSSHLPVWVPVVRCSHRNVGQLWSVY